HNAAWERVHHQDLSLKNLMYRKEGAEVFGVVNDWDLSYIVGGPKNTQSMMATIPFLSLQVLAYLASNQPIDRCYYHDLESFIWVLLWVFLFVEGGQVDHNNNNLKRLETGDAATCLGAKAGLLGYLGFKLVKPREEWRELWPVGSELIQWMDQYGKLTERGDDGPLFESFIKAVARSKPDGYTVPTTPTIIQQSQLAFWPGPENTRLGYENLATESKTNHACLGEILPTLRTRVGAESAGIYPEMHRFARCLGPGMSHPAPVIIRARRASPPGARVLPISTRVRQHLATLPVVSEESGRDLKDSIP
ncbi:hypothetical protein FRC10_008686, partial [Ceratobasidium sp. 414]